MADYITATTMAKLIDVTPRRLQQLVTEGVVPRVTKGKYELVPVVHAYIRYLREHRETEGEPDENDPKRELDDLRVQKARMDLAKERREFLPVSVLEHYAGQIGAIVHAALEALPGQIKARIPHLRAAEINMIRQLLVKIANQLAKFDARDPSGA